ncbi:MAG: hypothetical protein HC836_50150 [Richelia sp. RM2_1_2]|nr:hypothetical protein [Richelia sp. SM1_7_0]NJN12472.1 hypothetical protein [Richelia sp. RM1_1_1]NJO31596.1 hypothetical protein [Richelia sp. SL_2_1]NJO65954.1 hypothetical protein [Richelia sp. RM2_1_2]
MSNQQNNEGIVQSGGTINSEQLAVGRFAAVNGVVNKTINDLKSDVSNDSVKLADLLEQLKTAIESDPSLYLEEKVEILEQVQEIARAGSNPTSSEQTIKKVKTASRTLKGMLSELSHATQFIEASTKILPLITKIFGF